METLKSEYIEIPNEYGYYTINIDNGKLPELPDLPKKPRVRVRVSNTKPSQLKKLMTQLQKKCKIQESVITRVDGLSTEKIRDKKINIGDVNNPDYQYDLVREYLKDADVVHHLAGITDVARTKQESSEEKDKELNKIAAFEKAIANKYGKEAVQNPRGNWDEEKEKDYIEQVKKFQQKIRKAQSSAEKVEHNGFFVSKPLII